MKPRGNSIGLLAGAALAVVVMVAASNLDRDGSPRLPWRSAFVGFALVPLSIAIAELRSGYAWKNLAPGNRGVARVDGPRAFWISVVGHTAFACGLFALGVFATPPHTPTPNVSLQGNAGECDALTGLPYFGVSLPNLAFAKVDYISHRMPRQVLARARSRSIDFEACARQLGLKVIRYQSGFRNMGGPFEELPEKYRPIGDRVWVGYGALPGGGRAVVRLYFEPDAGRDDIGTLYIHIS